MILNVTLIKSIQTMQDTIDSQYSDKHATTKVILCKDLESSVLKGKLRLYQFCVKRIKAQTKTCNHTYQDLNLQ